MEAQFLGRRENPGQPLWDQTFSCLTCGPVYCSATLFIRGLLFEDASLSFERPISICKAAKLLQPNQWQADRIRCLMWWALQGPWTMERGKGLVSKPHSLHQNAINRMPVNLRENTSKAETMRSLTLVVSDRSCLFSEPGQILSTDSQQFLLLFSDPRRRDASAGAQLRHESGLEHRPDD